MKKEGRATTNISYLASEAERSLTGTSEAVEKFAMRIIAEPASMRREILLHLLYLMRAKKQPLPATATRKLLRLIIDPGKCKSDVAAGYFAAIFDCANSVESDSKDDSLRELFSLFLTNFGEGTSDYSKALHSLADVPAFRKAFELCLIQVEQYEFLKRYFGFWSMIVPELAAKPRPPLSQDAARAICNMIQEHKGHVSAPLRLSLLPLLRVAGDLAADTDGSRPLSAPLQVAAQEPQDLSGESRPSPVPLQVAAQELQGVPSGLRPTSVVSDEQSGAASSFPSSLPALRTAEKSISAALVELSRSVESGMRALSESNTRVEAERNAARKEASQLRDQCRELEHRIEGLRRDMDVLRGEYERQQSLLQNSEMKISEYDRNLESAYKMSDIREVDAISATKRKFANGQLSALTSLRDYLVRLRAERSESTVIMAIANFNRIVKFMLVERYVFDGELAPIPRLPQDESST